MTVIESSESPIVYIVHSLPSFRVSRDDFRPSFVHHFL